ncbi:MAG: TonB-dependent receptor [Ignavibacteriaceae bacterium]|nr:TonB-dependent receptor [Ignavibacteriaceae bacterium]NUM70460.1 TonB-dependent receptor [Ignavibacteriaceae bacterium]
MKKNLLAGFLSLLLSLFLFNTSAFAGVTGKIAGKVTDAETGEALIGINIIIQGTTMGAATGVDGTYIINNIEPGVYTLIFSGVGYQKKLVTKVQVQSDFTTRIDITMSSESIGLEEVVVEAKKPMVVKDLTSSQTVLDNTQIEALPVESIEQILSLQAGVTKGAGGELHIRGGRSTEIAYNVNGVSAINPFDFGRTVNISTNAIQEFSVVSGTFNAEYGNALSGIVNTITKEGGAKYTGSLSYYTGDYFSTSDDVFLNIKDFNPVNNQVLEGTFGGPVPYLNDNLSFFLSGRYNKDKGYLYGVRQHTIYDSVSRSDSDPNLIYLAQTGDNALVSMNPSTDLNTTAKLTFKPAPTIKINYDFVYSNSEYKSYTHDYKYNPDAIYNRYEWGLINSLEYRMAVSSSTFFSLKGSYNIYDFKRYLFPLLDASGNEVSFNPSMSLAGLRADPRYQPVEKAIAYSPYTFLSGGTQNEHYYQRSYTTELKFDITSQVTNQHEVKFGVKSKWDTMDFVFFSILRNRSTYPDPVIPDPVNQRGSIDIYSRSPQQFSAYLQDKMEFESMIVNAGVRMDYFKAGTVYAPDPFKPTENLTEAEAKITVSPRLGISFPITDQGIIHFSYGHFYQLPPFRYLYTNPEFEDIAALPVYGNANLNPEKTVTYELGLQQQLTEQIAFNVTGFYKDVRDLLAVQEIRISSSSTYQKYVNKDYGNIKGITFSLSKRKVTGELFGASIDYTFQVAEGNETGADAFFIDLLSGRQSEKVPVPLAWDQQHNLNGVITFGSDKDWSATLVASIGTGLPYSPRLLEQNIYLRTNSERKPFQSNVDLLIQKSFPLYDFMVTFFVKVFNLFDTRNERFVYDDTGRATYTLEEGKGGPQATNRISQLYPGIKSATEYFNRPTYYSSPREVRLGLTLEF